MNFDNLVKISKNRYVINIPQITKPASTFCDECIRGNQIKVSCKTKEYNTSRSLLLVHTNLCGPTRTRVLTSERYFMLFIEDYSRMTWVTFLHEKSQAFKRFIIFRRMVENDSGHQLKCLRSDQGGEYSSIEFIDYCEKHGILRQYSITRKPQQNGEVERKNRILKKMARTMLNEANIPDTY